MLVRNCSRFSAAWGRHISSISSTMACSRTGPAWICSRPDSIRDNSMMSLKMPTRVRLFLWMMSRKCCSRGPSPASLSISV